MIRRVIEGCRVLAERMWEKSQGDIAQATEQTFRLLTSRQATDREQKILLRQYADELSYFQENEGEEMAYLDIGKRKLAETAPKKKIAALARVTNTILNSTEAYYKN